MSTVIEPISVAVGDAVRVSGLLQMPSRARLLRAGAWSRSGNGSSVHGISGVGARAERRRHLALPVPIYGARRKAARSATTSPSNSSRCSGRNGGLTAETSARCRWQIVRRPDDITSSGQSAPTRCVWTRIPRISASPGRAPLAGPSRALI